MKKLTQIAKEVLKEEQKTKLRDQVRSKIHDFANKVDALKEQMRKDGYNI